MYHLSIRCVRVSWLSGSPSSQYDFIINHVFSTVDLECAYRISLTLYGQLVMLRPYCSAQAVGEHLLVESGKSAYSAYSVLRSQSVLRYYTCTVP